MRQRRDSYKKGTGSLVIGRLELAAAKSGICINIRLAQRHSWLSRGCGLNSLSTSGSTSRNKLATSEYCLLAGWLLVTTSDASRSGNTWPSKLRITLILVLAPALDRLPATSLNAPRYVALDPPAHEELAM